MNKHRIERQVETAIGTSIRKGYCRVPRRTLRGDGRPAQAIRRAAPDAAVLVGVDGKACGEGGEVGECRFEFLNNLGGEYAGGWQGG